MTPALTAPPEKPWRLGSAVVDGVIQYLSVSQIQAFASCERLWWWDKVKKQPRKQSGAQDKGIRAHKQWAHYLRTGEDVLDELTRIALPALPPPGSDLLVEQEFCPTDVPGGQHQSPVRAAGIPLVGDLDLYNPRTQRLTDHKTSSDPKKWAAHEKYLRTVDLEAIRADADGNPGAGIQMVGYGIWLLQTQTRTRSTIELEHIVTPTKYRKRDLAAGLVKPTVVLAKTTPTEIEVEWRKVDQLVERQKVVATMTDAVPEPNWNACEKYGGCSFKEQCFTYQTKARTNVANLMDRLKKTGSAAPLAPPPPAAPQAAAAPAAPPPPPVQFGSIKAGDCVLEQTYVLDAEGTRGKFDGASGRFAFFTLDDGSAKKLLAIETVEPVKVAAPVPTPPPPAPKVEVAVTDSTIPAPAVAAAIKAEVAEAKKTRAKKTDAPPAAEVLKVFADAVPNGPYEQLAPYVNGIVAKIEQQFGVVDIRVASKDNSAHQPLTFGGWKGVLSAAIKAEPPKPGIYVATGTAGDELMQVAIAALETVCAPGDLTRGVR